MWRRSIVGSFAFLPLSAVAQQQRSIFVRDHRSPITVKKDGLTYPAVMSWKFRSDRPRHLVVNITRPPRAAMTNSEDIFDEEAEGSNAAEKSASVSYTFGRLFLRPYNVGQLLAVLQGWTAQPASIVREHTSLTLTPVAATGTAKQAAPLSSFTLTGTFTTKTNPLVRPREVVSTTFEDDDGIPGSTYNLGDVRAIEMSVDDSEVMLLTTHLEAVLRDLFRIEHDHHYRVMRLAVGRQRDRLLGSSPLSASSYSSGGRDRRYASRDRNVSRASAATQSGTEESQYRSRAPSYGSRGNGEKADQQQRPGRASRRIEKVEEDLSAPFDDTDSREATKAAASAAVSAFVAGGKAPSGVPLATQAAKEEEVEEAGDVEEEAESLEEFSVDDVAGDGDEGPTESTVYEDIEAVSTPCGASELAGAKQGNQEAAEEDEEEYEEVEVVEEVEEDDDDDNGKPRVSSVAEGSTAATTGGDGGAVHAAASSTTKTTTVQSVQRGEVEFETPNRYTQARFVRGDNFDAADINEVGKAFGLDVVQNVKVARMTNRTPTGGETKGTTAFTSGAFRSEGGTVTGSYQILNRRVESTVGTATATQAAAPLADEVIGEKQSAKEGEDEEEVDEEAEETAEPASAATKTSTKKAKAKRSKRKGTRKKKGKGKAKKSVKAEDVIEENVTF